MEFHDTLFHFSTFFKPFLLFFFAHFIFVLVEGRFFKLSCTCGLDLVWMCLSISFLIFLVHQSSLVRTAPLIGRSSTSINWILFHPFPDDAGKSCFREILPFILKITTRNFETQVHNLSGDTTISDNQFKFFASHVHLFKDKNMQILLCIP